MARTAFDLLLMVTCLLGLAAIAPPALAGTTDYSQPASWAALPGKVPGPNATTFVLGGQTLRPAAKPAADAFYVHPTTFQPSAAWGYMKTVIGNGSPRDAATVKAVDTAVKQQASALSSTARIFAPRYQQVSAMTFMETQGGKNQQALDVAFADVRAAFEYYVKNYNPGLARPLFLMGHSQGSTMVSRLLKEVILPDPKLRGRIVAAYLLGELFGSDSFGAGFRSCSGAEDTGCFVSWASAARGAKAKYACGAPKVNSDCKAAPTHTQAAAAVCNNPLIWQLATPGESGTYAGQEMNLGTGPFPLPEVSSLSPSSGNFVVHWADGQCDGKGILRVSPNSSANMNYEGFDVPVEIGEALGKGDYHVWDVALYWADLRENAKARAAKMR